MIEVSNLSKIYKTKKGDVNALLDVNLHVEKSDIFGIIGMSGAGKSTLIRCIGLLEEPTTGKITIDGVDMTTLKGKEKLRLRRQIGTIFQGYHLLMQRTVAGNLSFPMELAGISKEKRQEKIKSLLKLVGLEDRADAYPAQLSGGQKQRFAIARALTCDPKVLLCDEPTSALDSLTTRSILKLLREINCELGVTVVIITHEIGVVRAICNKVAVIDKNRILEQGNAREVLEQPKSEITRSLIGIGGDFS